MCVSVSFLCSACKTMNFYVFISVSVFYFLSFYLVFLVNNYVRYLTKIKLEQLRTYRTFYFFFTINTYLLWSTFFFFNKFIIKGINYMGNKNLIVVVVLFFFSCQFHKMNHFIYVFDFY